MNALQSFENRLWHTRALNRALRSTYIIWAKSHPAWEDALFDKSFVQHEVKPILRRFVNGESGISATELVQTWMEHLRLTPQRRQVWSGELAPVARDFLRILQSEFEYECQRRQRSLWFKLWHGAGSRNGEPAPVISGG